MTGDDWAGIVEALQDNDCNACYGDGGQWVFTHPTAPGPHDLVWDPCVRCGGMGG